jgi:hypothetical protein
MQSLPEREFSTDELVAIESDRRRRVLAAFLLGSEARPEEQGLQPWRGVFAGLCLAAAALLVVGVLALASASLPSAH